MIRLLALLLLPLAVFAEVDSFQVGEPLSHLLTICLQKEDALAVAKVDAKEGFEPARKLFTEKDECAVLPVSNAEVGRVVHTEKVKRDDKERTLSVVEIVRDGKVLAYFITSTPVLARLTVVPNRGANS